MSSGKHVGSVRVSNTESYPYTTIYGYVQSNGHYNSTGKASEELSDRIRRFLSQFGENPQKVSKDYGHFTGKCCFCNTKLTDDTSTRNGLRPDVCQELRPAVQQSSCAEVRAQGL